jgi:hypothetical protein
MNKMNEKQNVFFIKWVTPAIEILAVTPRAHSYTVLDDRRSPNGTAAGADADFIEEIPRDESHWGWENRN